jgi:hypothetical protein
MFMVICLNIVFGCFDVALSHMDFNLVYGKLTRDRAFFLMFGVVRHFLEGPGLIPALFGRGERMFMNMMRATRQAPVE